MGRCMDKSSFFFKIGTACALSILVMGLVACKGNSAHPVSTVKESAEAKRMLQGMWLNEDDESLSFRAKGDTIYYPDSTSMPEYFKIVADTLFMGDEDDATTYAFVKQTPHLFVMKNQGSDVIRLVKTEDRFR